MATQFLLRVPPWVWALLLALIVLGLRARHERSVAPRTLLILPLVFLLLDRKSVV